MSGGYAVCLEADKEHCQMMRYEKELVELRARIEKAEKVLKLQICLDGHTMECIRAEGNTFTEGCSRSCAEIRQYFKEERK